MSSFDLYYWPVPFRGEFIRAILAFGKCRWEEHDSDDIADVMGRPVERQPVGFMGPPVLVDRQTGFAVSQMPAIAVYLGEKLALLPDTAEGRALALKLTNDANDVIDELTLDGGREMWTPEKWAEFVPRFQRWMRIFEDTGKRHGLTSEKGFMLGTEKPGLEDIITATLWITMSDRFSTISVLVKETAPCVWNLSNRMMELQPLAEMKAKSFEKFGQAYCGGEIEKSLRLVAA